MSNQPSPVGAGQPNPGAFFVQIESDYTIYRELDGAGLGPNVFADLGTLIGLANNALLQRLGYTILIAGHKYGTAMAKSLGWYATIAIHNSAINATWDGGSATDPYGSPNTPA